MSPQDWPLLLTIESPDDLRRLPAERLPQLARELRLFLIESVSATGGHLAANLGVIELTIALHFVFDTPADKLVWDVGHQTYAHKILTGRRLAMAGIRQHGGIAGFPKREESRYDAFGTGHSSTSISAALGMALAMQRSQNPAKAVAIIGDGAMSGGMSFEALNHAGDSDADLLVILNDNDMSISENVGALSNHLTRLLSGQLAYTMRERSKRVLDHLPLPGVREMARRAEEHVKGMVAPGTLFEELGFNYFGPVDGHDIDTLVSVLQNLRQMSGRRFLHITTRKGKGYFPAENDPRRFHGVGRFETSTGEATDPSPPAATYTQVFSDWLCDMAEEDARLAGITPAMREGSGLVAFSKKYPDRYFDVGIAEQHAITLAAGMACEGMKPVVAIYSTFLQRGYDQLIHDVALQNLPVLFAIDRAGVVGADGPTHTGAYDISFLRCIPNMVVMTPADAGETRAMLTAGFLHDGPAAVRYPRGKTGGSIDTEALIAVPFGKAVSCREGEDIAILAFGPVLQELLPIADSLHATLVNMRFVKPLDMEMLEALATRHRLIVTVEDNAVAGGAGSAVNEWLLQQGHACAVMNLGYPDAIVSLGTQAEQLADWKLDGESIRRRIEQRLALL